MSYKSAKLRVDFFGAAHRDRLGHFEIEPVPGKSTPGRFMERSGGAALNAARIFHALGGLGRLFSVVGDDAHGQGISGELEQLGIGGHLQKHTDCPTASYTALIKPDGSVLYGLADMHVYERFQASNFALGADQPDFAFIDANLPETAIAELIDRVSSKICLATISPAKAARLRKCLGNCALLVTNSEEAAALLGSSSASSAVLAKGLIEQCVETCVISDGGNPVCYADRNGHGSVAVDRTASLVDATGAGDSLCAAVMFGLANGWPLEKAVRFGVAVAQQIIQIEGPWNEALLNSLPELLNAHE